MSALRGPTRAALLEGLRTLIRECTEAREPIVLVAGTVAYALPALHWAAKRLGIPCDRAWPDATNRTTSRS